MYWEGIVVQPVDFTTLAAACWELRMKWLPARLEQVYQRDRTTVALALRTLEQRGWLTISWHAQAARLCIGDPPPRQPDTFTFSQQLWHQLRGLALVGIVAIAPWERVLDLQFARRPGDPIRWHLYVEIMGKYSNVILADADNTIVTAAHQVSPQQSSVRPIQTGQPYVLPPALTEPVPSLHESRHRWQERVSLVPGALGQCLLKNYRGLSSALVRSMTAAAGLDPAQSTEQVSGTGWQQLFCYWQSWLGAIEQFTADNALEPLIQAGWTDKGYTILGWNRIKVANSVQTLLNRYYTDQLNQQRFNQLRHQIGQKLKVRLKKLHTKRQTFQDRLQQSDRADNYRTQADLLMAHLQHWQPGMRTIVVTDFETGKPIELTLNPEKNAVQNAQILYKSHQKLKRTYDAVTPLLTEVQAEIHYLEQVEVALVHIDTYRTETDLQTLEEIYEELSQQQYLPPLKYQNQSRNSTDRYRNPASQPYCYLTPNGIEVLIGRNNRQNDWLTFRLANDYDLWFHTQEIAGSHGLLRLAPGAAADDVDLQFVADLMAYYSRARQSKQVPIVYTEPKYLYKPKGARPGVAIYKRERVLWGEPERAHQYLEDKSQNFS